MTRRDHTSTGLLSGLALAALTLQGCAFFKAPPDPEPVKRPEQVLAITQAHELIRVNAGHPSQVLSRQAVVGLAPGESVVGMDFRVARGVLYVLSDRGQLYTLDTSTARLTPVGQGVARAQLRGQKVGVDFNPVADRIRVVTESGQNWRMHPDSGQWIEGDGPLAYVAGDPQHGKQPRVAAAAYTYNKDNDKITTNYAIDLGQGLLVRQGSLEGVQPVVLPNTGQLQVVGPLGVKNMTDASFDIADTNNAALAALYDGRRVRLYDIRLETGQATLLGTIGNGQAIRGMAIEP